MFWYLHDPATMTSKIQHSSIMQGFLRNSIYFSIETRRWKTKIQTLVIPQEPAFGHTQSGLFSTLFSPSLNHKKPGSITYGEQNLAGGASYAVA